MDRCTRCFGDLEDLAVFCPQCAQAHEPVFDRLIDLRIDDRYRIYRRLSQGGLSSVFAATDLMTDSVVVIKISDPAQLVRKESSYAIDPRAAQSYWAEMLERMRREVEHLKRIDHPNIVRFLGTGTINSELRYVAMEFLHGRTLRRFIDEGGHPGIDKAMVIARQTCDALKVVHNLGIVHRDLNPSNIILCEPLQSEDECEDLTAIHARPDVQIKLIDFGIAKFPQPAGAPPFTRNASLRGTVSYSSPEQCQGLEVDPRSDIYSLAIVCYEMFTGQRPFDGRTPTEIALKHIQAMPPEPRSVNPEIPQGMNRAILRGLAKKPSERQASVDEFLSELESGRSQFTVSFVQGDAEEFPAAEMPSDRRETKDRAKLARKRRRRLAVAGVAMLIALTAGGLLLATQMLWRYRPSQELNAKGSNRAQPDTQTAPHRVSDNGEFFPGSDADSLEMAARSSELKETGSRVPFQIKTAPIISPRSVRPNDKVVKPQPGKSQRSAAARVIVKPAAGSFKAPQMESTKGAPGKTNATRPEPKPAPRLETSDNRQAENRPVRPQPTVPDRSSEDRSRENDAKAVQSPEPGSIKEDQDTASSPPIETARTQSRPRSVEEKPLQIGPKLLKWEGDVNRVREIRIEMPGLPGTIDIPRIYRDRVAVVEPPSPSNNWKYAILRVFGRGNVSILIRWWPISQNQIAEYK